MPLNKEAKTKPVTILNTINFRLYDMKCFYRKRDNLFDSLKRT